MFNVNISDLATDVYLCAVCTSAFSGYIISSHTACIAFSKLTLRYCGAMHIHAVLVNYQLNFMHDYYRCLRVCALDLTVIVLFPVKKFFLADKFEFVFTLC